jgi:hypothetical protein
MTEQIPSCLRTAIIDREYEGSERLKINLLEPELTPELLTAMLNDGRAMYRIAKGSQKNGLQVRMVILRTDEPSTDETEDQFNIGDILGVVVDIDEASVEESWELGNQDD